MDRCLRTAALIGKIGFPDRLFEPHRSKNPPEVVAAIMRHPATSAQILKELDFLGPALDYIYCHHERPDGKGYPIPDGSRTRRSLWGRKSWPSPMAYDAMTTDRP